jgi:hypothetical protein
MPAYIRDKLPNERRRYIFPQRNTRPYYLRDGKSLSSLYQFPDYRPAPKVFTHGQVAERNVRGQQETESVTLSDTMNLSQGVKFWIIAESEVTFSHKVKFQELAKLSPPPQGNLD